VGCLVSKWRRSREGLRLLFASTSPQITHRGFGHSWSPLHVNPNFTQSSSYFLFLTCDFPTPLFIWSSDTNFAHFGPGKTFADVDGSLPLVFLTTPIFRHLSIITIRIGKPYVSKQLKVSKSCTLITENSKHYISHCWSKLYTTENDWIPNGYHYFGNCAKIPTVLREDQEFVAPWNLNCPSLPPRTVHSIDRQKTNALQVLQK
jgi:hypothetical protein